MGGREVSHGEEGECVGTTRLKSFRPRERERRVYSSYRPNQFILYIYIYTLDGGVPFQWPGGRAAASSSHWHGSSSKRSIYSTMLPASERACWPRAPHSTRVGRTAILRRGQLARQTHAATTHPPSSRLIPVALLSHGPSHLATERCCRSMNQNGSR